MCEIESSLQRFGEFLLARRLVRPNAAPFVVRWVRQFLERPATNDPLADEVRRFCEDLERAGRQDWQVRQAEQALRIYFVNFLNRTDWHRQPPSTVIDAEGRADPLTAVQQLRARIRMRHYSYRTESSYADWVHRFLEHSRNRTALAPGSPRLRSATSSPTSRSIDGSPPAPRTRRSARCSSWPAKFSASTSRA